MLPTLYRVDHIRGAVNLRKQPELPSATSPSTNTIPDRGQAIGKSYS